MKTRNIRSFWSLLTCFTMATSTSAQYWEETGSPVYTPAPTIVYADSVHDWLLVAGQGPFIDNMYFPLMRYDGTQWDTLGLFGNQIRSAIVYHDTLIVGGGFTFMAGSNIGQIAYYADGIWHPYGEFADQWGDGLIQRLRLVDGDLYALGQFENVDGQFCNGLAKRVGGHWEPMPGWANLNFTIDTRLGDIIRYQGKLVVAGAFHNPELSLMNMLQYDGGEWLPVCTNCLHGGQDGVGALIEYEGDLYAGGIFFYATGNAGQGIMRWDGEQWYPLKPMGEGLQNINYSDQYSPSIIDLKVREGLLYIGGGYKFVDHVATPAGICAWDGTDFCILQGEPFSDYYAPFDFYHDTLYGGTGPGVDDPALRGAIRYLGELCTSTVGVEENAAVAKPLQVVWSPTGELAVLGLSDGTHQLKVYDAQGRLVLDQQITSTAGRGGSVNFSERGAAVYLVVVDHERTGRLVPLR